MRWSVPAAMQAAAFAVAVAALATVCCTAMIYASLKTVPAWSQRLVVPAGSTWSSRCTPAALLYLSIYVVAGAAHGVSAQALTILATTSLATAWIKEGYWHAIDRIALPSREAATALEGFGKIATFERPHTEANYLTREMGFVLARKHSRRLRTLALLLFAVAPLLALIASALLPAVAAFALPLAALAALAGAFVERWLFFAEAKHMVMLYY